MSPIRDKLFVISLIVLTALAIAAVPRIHAEPAGGAERAPTSSSDTPTGTDP